MILSFPFFTFSMNSEELAVKLALLADISNSLRFENFRQEKMVVLCLIRWLLLINAIHNRHKLIHRFPVDRSEFEMAHTDQTTNINRIPPLLKLYYWPLDGHSVFVICCYQRAIQFCFLAAHSRLLGLLGSSVNGKGTLLFHVHYSSCIALIVFFLGIKKIISTNKISTFNVNI